MLPSQSYKIDSYTDTRELCLFLFCALKLEHEEGFRVGESAESVLSDNVNSSSVGTEHVVGAVQEMIHQGLTPV